MENKFILKEKMAYRFSPLIRPQSQGFSIDDKLNIWEAADAITVHLDLQEKGRIALIKLIVILEKTQKKNTSLLVQHHKHGSNTKRTEGSY